jgi:hypothetical protein
VIYFIRCATLNLKAVKIGFTDGNPIDRLSAIQVSCPFGLELIGSIQGDQKKEAALHLQFDHLRIRGEWFREASELTSEIDQLLNRKKSEIAAEIPRWMKPRSTASLRICSEQSDRGTMPKNAVRCTVVPEFLGRPKSMSFDTKHAYGGLIDPENRGRHTVPGTGGYVSPRSCGKFQT